MFLHNIVNDWIVRCLKLRLIIPSIENASLILSFMWSLNETDWLAVSSPHSGADHCSHTNSTVIRSCARTSYASRILRPHGMDHSKLQTAYRSSVVIAKFAKLSYTFQCLIGFYQCYWSTKTWSVHPMTSHDSDVTKFFRPRQRAEQDHDQDQSKTEWQHQDHNRASVPRLFVQYVLVIIKTVSFQCI